MSSMANTRRETVWRDQFKYVPPGVTLLSCPRCFAAVPAKDAQRHADWHNGTNGSEAGEQE